MESRASYRESVLDKKDAVKNLIIYPKMPFLAVKCAFFLHFFPFSPGLACHAFDIIGRQGEERAHLAALGLDGTDEGFFSGDNSTERSAESSWGCACPIQRWHSSSIGEFLLSRCHDITYLVRDGSYRSHEDGPALLYHRVLPDECHQPELGSLGHGAGVGGGIAVLGSYYLLDAHEPLQKP